MLGISMNFKVLSETPQAEAIQLGEGKRIVCRAVTSRQFADTGDNIQHTAWIIEEQQLSMDHTG